MLENELEINPEKLLSAVTNLARIRDDIKQVETTFASKIKQGSTLLYRNLGGRITFSKNILSQFETSVRTATNPDRIRQDLAAILRSAKLGVENQAPAFFNEFGTLPD